MAGEDNGGYVVGENERFKADVKYLCREIDVGFEHVETIINVVRLAVLRNPQNLPAVPNKPDKRFVFTSRVNRNGIQIPALRVLIKIVKEEHRIELLALASCDVRL